MVTRTALLRSSPTSPAPPSSVLPKPQHQRERRRVGEVAGGTAAECAAVCCCCPCSVMNLLILAVYKVPKGLCTKAWASTKKRRRKAHQSKKGLLQPKPNGLAGSGLFFDDMEGHGKRRAVDHVVDDDQKIKSDAGESEGADLLENEMWDSFYAAGFWRSASKREHNNNDDVVLGR